MAEDFKIQVETDLDTSKAEQKLNALLKEKRQIKLDIDINNQNIKNISKNIEKGIKNTKIDTSAITKQLADSFNVSDKSVLKNLNKQLNSMISNLGKTWNGEKFDFGKATGFYSGLDNMAKTITSNSKIVKSATGYYDDFYNYFKNKKIYVSDDLKKALGGDTYKELLQNNIGKITKDAKKGISIDSLWGEMTNLFPEHFSQNITRCIVYENGEYRLLRGSIDKWTGDTIYTLRKERYIKYTQTYAYKKIKVTGDSLVVENFIVNYDVANNTRIWHLNNDILDGYYKHLYPVTEKQYLRLRELQEQSSEPLSEDVIMDVINAVEYKQEGWNPWDYHRGLCGVGYSGMKMNTEMRHSVSYYKWKNMVQRCYDKKVHKKYKPEYKDKSVCEEWLNYSNFRIWFDEHYVPCKNNQIDLDKDLLVQGNKVYSPETCVFLLHYQNTMFERSAKDKIYEKEDGTFVIGGGKKKTYATLKEAEDIVCERNQNRIESVAEKCKGSIPMCAYEAMLNWDVRLAMCS